MENHPPGLADLVTSIESISPTVPDELTRHELKRKGWDCQDIRLLRLVSLAAQKFVGDIVRDAALLEKERQRLQPERLRELGYEAGRQMHLRHEDVAQALEECGLSVKAVPYFADGVVTKGPS